MVGCRRNSASSADPIQKLVPSSREGQEPGLARVESEWRLRERDADQRILHLVSRHHLGNLLPLVSGHGNAVSGVSNSVVHAVDLSGMRHDVKSKIQRT